MLGKVEARPFWVIFHRIAPGHSNWKRVSKYTFQAPTSFVEMTLSTITRNPRNAMFNTPPTAWCY